HKFDPISQKEYYQFFALFNQTADADRPDESPVIPAPSPAILEEQRKLDERIAALKKELGGPSPQLDAEQARWEESLRTSGQWLALDPVEARSEGGATLKKQSDLSLRAEGPNPANDTYTITTQVDLKGIIAVRLEVIPDAALPNAGVGRAADGNFVLSRFGVVAAPAGRDDAPVKARFVRIELPGDGRILSLAEVQVFRLGENLARKGKAEQSSTDYDGTAPLASDRNTNGDYYGSKSTTHTKQESNPWWEVKLAALSPVDQVVVWNRTDGNVGVRLAGFKLLLLDDERKVVWQQTIAEAPNPKRELSPDGN